MIQRLTIIGVGLLGGSVGLAAKSRINGFRITGYGQSGGAAALAAGAVDVWEANLAAAVGGADFIVLAVPVGLIPACLSDIAPHLAAGTVVTDVGSAKSAVVAAGEQAIRPPAAFVGSHPMAGGSQSGVAAARADLFENAPCVITPTPATDRAALEKVRDFWTALGGRVIEQAPAEHDRVVALASHLPHALAAALMAVQEGGSLAVRGKGFADTSRVAAGDPALWRDIFAVNRPNVLTAVDAVLAELTAFRARLAAGDDQAIFDWLQTEARRRRELD